MDIKFVWIEQQRRHAFILTVLDVFTRTALAWHIGFSITQYTIKQIWESVIINHLQTNNMLEKGISIEVRNDNDPGFSAKMVQDFFKTNHLNQVFTYLYTPQENRHIESFHAILGKSLDQKHFEMLRTGVNSFDTILYEIQSSTFAWLNCQLTTHNFLGTMGTGQY